MSKIKVRILKNFKASTDGNNLQDYKEGEILELGTLRLNSHLFEWFENNVGFGKIFNDEENQDKKDADNADKTLKEAKEQNESFVPFDEVFDEKSEIENATESEKTEKKIKEEKFLPKSKAEKSNSKQRINVFTNKFKK